MRAIRTMPGVRKKTAFGEERIGEKAMGEFAGGR